MDAIKWLAKLKVKEPVERKQSEAAFQAHVSPLLRKESEPAIKSVLFIFFQNQPNEWASMNPEPLLHMVYMLMAMATPEALEGTTPPPPLPVHLINSEKISKVRSDLAALANELIALSVSLPNLASRPRAKGEGAEGEGVEGEGVEGEGNAHLDPKLQMVPLATFLATLGELTSKLSVLQGTVETKLVIPLEQKEAEVRTLTNNLQAMEDRMDMKNEEHALNLQALQTRMDEKSDQDSARMKELEDRMASKDKETMDLFTKMNKKIDLMSGQMSEQEITIKKLKEEISTLSEGQKSVLDSLGIVRLGQDVSDAAIARILFEIAVRYFVHSVI